MSVQIVDPERTPGGIIVAAPPEAEAAFAAATSALYDRINSGEIELVSDSAYKKLKFGSQKEIFKNWKKPAKCRYPGCGDKTIRRSHTLQKAGPLARIKSGDGHVIAPTLDYVKKEIVYERKGVDHASTFPGFCDRHELLFADLETRGTLEHPRDFVLQLFRSVAREAVRIRFDIDHHSRARDKFLALRDKNLAKLVHDEVSALLASHPILAKYKIQIPPDRGAQLAEWLESARTDLATIEGMTADLVPALGAVDQGALGANIHRFVLNHRLPVTLSGQSAINFNVGPDPHRLILFLVVIPEDTRTQVLIASRWVQAPLLDRYLRDTGLEADDGAEKAENLLGLIESFLLYGTDHWFFEETYWKSLPPASRDAILASVVKEEKRVGDEPCCTVLPRLAGLEAVREPLLVDRRSPRQRARAERRERGWTLFERLPVKQARALLLSRKSPRLSAMVDNYTGDIHAFSRNSRDKGWVFTRTLRDGQWSTPWRRIRWSQIAPYGFRRRQ